MVQDASNKRWGSINHAEYWNMNVEKPQRSNWELRRNKFSQRIVDDWNLLPEDNYSQYIQE